MKSSILFMGTPEFAIPSLKALVESGYNVAGVITQPGKPKGRGRKYIAPPVKACALDLGIPVYQPGRVRDQNFKYRGAAPINWPIINGDRKTGVTIMLMDEGVDSGDILLQEETDIDADETFDDLHEKLSTMGAELLIRTVKGVIDGTISGAPQDTSLVTLAPRLGSEAGHIDWNDESEKIVNLIRGLSARPGAYSFLGDKKLKIFYAVAGKENSSGEKAPGTPGKLMEAGLQVATGDGHVYLKDVQLEGKKRMPVEDFLRGYHLLPDDMLE